jgi:molybdenum cofactor cytidylyltransferase
MSDAGDGLPVVDPPDADPDTRDGGDGTGEGDRRPRVAAVLLAAGTGSRFEGGNKLLADVDGEAVVVRAARALLAAGLPTVAVLGHEADRVGAALTGVDHGGRLALAGNPDYRSGQASSVRAGLRAVRDVDAAAFALGDMPRVRPDSVRALVRAYRDGAGDALAAAHRSRRGNPVLFDRRHFPALAAVEGDRGGREVLLSGDRSALVETGDPGVVRDVDTVEDVERL